MRLISDDTWGAINIWAEARSEPFDGQIAVGNVVRERMRLKYSSNGTVVGTIWRPKQFSWTLGSDPQRLWALSLDDEHHAWARAMEAWKESASVYAVPPGTVLYHAEYVSPRWAENAEFVKQIGAHLFYKDPSHG